ncbi:hypothetical protein L9F63_019470, partial [Diploptera punctata]
CRNSEVESSKSRSEQSEQFVSVESILIISSFYDLYVNPSESLFQIYESAPPFLAAPSLAFRNRVHLLVPLKGNSRQHPLHACTTKDLPSGPNKWYAIAQLVKFKLLSQEVISSIAISSRLVLFNVGFGLPLSLFVFGGSNPMHLFQSNHASNASTILFVVSASVLMQGLPGVDGCNATLNS